MFFNRNQPIFQVDQSGQMMTLWNGLDRVNESGVKYRCARAKGSASKKRVSGALRNEVIVFVGGPVRPRTTQSVRNQTSILPKAPRVLTTLPLVESIVGSVHRQMNQAW
jgi:hypothetical protein